MNLDKFESTNLRNLTPPIMECNANIFIWTKSLQCLEMKPMTTSTCPNFDMLIKLSDVTKLWFLMLGEFNVFWDALRFPILLYVAMCTKAWANGFS